MMIAIPAAPAPEVTIFTSSSFLPTSFNALITPASVITAVPCWSSWKIGISRRFLFSFFSISKHLGAEISSRLIPPKDAEEAYCLNDLINIFTADAERNRVYTAKFFKEYTFTFHNRHTSFGPISPVQVPRFRLLQQQLYSSVLSDHNSCLHPSGSPDKAEQHPVCKQGLKHLWNLLWLLIQPQFYLF